MWFLFSNKKRIIYYFTYWSHNYVNEYTFEYIIHSVRVVHFYNCEHWDNIAWLFMKHIV